MLDTQTGGADAGSNLQVQVDHWLKATQPNIFKVQETRKEQRLKSSWRVQQTLWPAKTDMA